MDKLYLELAQFVKAKTPVQRTLEWHVQNLITAGCEALNCMAAGSDVQTERVKYYAQMNHARSFLGLEPIDPDLSKHELDY